MRASESLLGKEALVNVPSAMEHSQNLNSIFDLSVEDEIGGNSEASEFGSKFIAPAADARHVGQALTLALQGAYYPQSRSKTIFCDMGSNFPEVRLRQAGKL